MKQVRFAFYLAKFEWRNIFNKDKKLHVVDDAISWWTWLFNWFTPGYSHVEVWIPNAQGEFVYEIDLFPADRDNLDVLKAGYEYKGTCFTSTMRSRGTGKKKVDGTVSRAASEVFTNPKRWHYLEFEVTDESFAEAKAWADERVENNKGYSMKDIRRFFMPLWLLKKLKWDDPEREICSEHAEGWAIRLSHILIVGPASRQIYIAVLREILIRSPRRLWRDLVRRHHTATYSLATGLMVYDSNGKRVK